MTRSRKYSVALRGHGTSITLEPAFWDALKTIAAQTEKSVGQIIEQVDSSQPENLSGAVRVHILDYFRKRAGV